MRKELRLLTILASLVLTACAAKRPAPARDDPPEVMGPAIPDQSVQEEPVSSADQPPPEAYGPAMPPEGVIPAPDATGTASTATSTSTDTATAVEAPAAAAKLCLVLGPGMAKAMSQAAVLAALKKAKLPVHCVVGTEMGALVGALYSFSNGSTNNLQWQLFKLSKESYFNFPMLSLREPRSSGGKLHEFLEGAFKGKKIEELPIPFATIAVDEERDATVELTHGDLADALSASVAVPGIFDPWKVGSDRMHSAALSDPLPIELARKLGGTFLVAVDVLTDSGAAKSRFAKAFAPARSLMKLQRKEASFVIQVATPNIQFDDFSRQGEILAAGTAAAEKALPELKAAWERVSAGAR